MDEAQVQQMLQDYSTRLAQVTHDLITVSAASAALRKENVSLREALRQYQERDAGEAVADEPGPAPGVLPPVASDEA